MMSTINLKCIQALLLLCLLAACSPSNAISYNVATQEIKSCRSRAISDVTITNDAGNESYMVMWNERAAAPAPGILKLYPLSEGYTILNKDIIQLTLQPDATYTIRRSGGDRAGYAIKVFTDKNGLIYKTDQAECR